MLGIVLSVSSMVLYLSETGLHIHLAISRFHVDFNSFVIILSLVAGPLVIVNIISTMLVLRTMDFSGRGCARTICVLLHFLQVGLLWRCLKLILLFDEHDWKEFLILRLVHTALQSLPIAILKGSNFFSGSDTTEAVFALVVISVVSNGLVFSMFNTGKYLFESDEFSEFSIRIRKPIGILVLTFGTIFLLFSRLGSMMLLLAKAPVWLALPLGAHFLIYFISTTIHRFCKNTGSIVWTIKNLCYSYFNVFDLFDQENQKLACSNVLLYSFILIQNVILTGFWMMSSDWDYKYKLGTVVSVILTFVCGMFLKCCSCSYLQNDKFEPFSDATYQQALEIAMKNTSEIIGVKNEYEMEIRNHEQYGEFENNCAVISLENGIIHKIPQAKRRKGNTHNVDNNKNEKSIEKDDSTPSRKKGRKLSTSNGDIASSNSRNTNTLNISDPSNVFNHSQSNNIKFGRIRNAQTMPCISSRRRPELTVRTSDKRPSDLEIKRSFCKSPPKNRKSPLPLFPNECSDFVSNKTFESKHVLSNSVREYNGSETDTSDSEYVSYSYYVTSTDWSTMSCDSNSATWPPSNIMTFINLHCLPKHKISATDSVQLWLSQLDEWEPSIEYDSFELTSQNKSTSPVPSSEHTDKSRSSKYRNFSKESHFTNPEKIQESDILLRPKDALLQFKESNTLSYLPYNQSDYDKTRQLSSENTIVIWHERDTTSTSTVQESMV